jgi:two-component system sensor histidine kinase DctS
LINNAYDAVMSLDSSERLVKVYIGSNDEHYIFKVSNYGYIEDDITQNMLRKGFSTKKGNHSGLGLHICHKLALKYGGKLDISNSDKHMVEISVYFPRVREKGDLHESAGQKNSSFAG